MPGDHQVGRRKPTTPRRRLRAWRSSARSMPSTSWPRSSRIPSGPTTLATSRTASRPSVDGAFRAALAKLQGNLLIAWSTRSASPDRRGEALTGPRRLPRRTSSRQQPRPWGGSHPGAVASSKTPVGHDHGPAEDRRGRRRHDLRRRAPGQGRPPAAMACSNGREADVRNSSSKRRPEPDLAGRAGIPCWSSSSSPTTAMRGRG